MKIAVKYLDGRTVDAVIIPFDTVQLERKYDVSIAQLEESGKVEHVLFLAWTSLARTAMVGGQDFDAWAATVEDVDDGDETEDEAGNGDGAEGAEPPARPTPSTSPAE